MSKIPLHYVDLRAFCYATEDDKRVEQALEHFLPEDVDLERTETTGHYGDRILVYSVRVERADELRHVLDRLAAGPDVDRVIDELDDRVTENTELFLSLDKQSAFGGTTRLGDGITFRGKLEAYPATREAAVENARTLLTELVSDSTA
ncbi:RNA-binding protein [Halovivax cerinus]|uniref:RNA-binding protein n=1 Tax=Halovivax cerinus TaxID=1487865 RepID=A0ABD5NSW2_9EURY|nr:RNA-binding protein [Halovivax cerinus]